jgi:phosphoglycolate phosphatase
MPVRGILFDKDGTLLDFQGTYGPATEKIIVELSHGDDRLAGKLASAVGLDRIRCRFDKDSIVIAGTGHDISEVWHALLPHWAKDDLTRRIDALYAEHSRATLTAFEDVADALCRLIDSGFVLGVATNDTAASAKAHLEGLALTGYFDFVVGYDSGYGRKPKPGMIQGFADHTGLQTSEIAMVGDSLHDLQSARFAGSLAIGVLTGPADHATLAELADHVLTSVSELPSLLG